ncbi:hypothetical protein ACVWYQ_003605 [Bradyrhizobium sp. USDA 3397]
MSFCHRLHRSPFVRRLHRASWVLRLRRHLRAGSSDGGRAWISLRGRAGAYEGTWSHPRTISGRQFRLRLQLGGRRRPVESRPARLDLAWLSTENNRFGANDFIHWCRAAGLESMLAVNLDTRDGDAARNLVEYCNYPGATAWSDLRRAHGWEKPRVNVFGLSLTDLTPRPERVRSLPSNRSGKHQAHEPNACAVFGRFDARVSRV